MSDDMYEVTIFIPNGGKKGRKEKMLLRTLKSEKDIISALKYRGTLHTDACQMDVGGYFNDRHLWFSDAITGRDILTVMW